MKHLLLVLITIVTPFLSRSQEKPSLTKEETVTYIQKKFNELIKGSISEPGKTTWICWQQTIRLNDDNVEIFQSINNDKGSEFGTYTTRWTNQYGANTRFYDCDYEKYKTTIKFNPTHITDIKADPDIAIDSEVGRMIITLSTKNARVNRLQTITSNKSNGSCLELGDGTNEDFVTSQFIIYFPQADDTNFSKIKKALEYLRDLVKTSDPFGN